jgi:DNA-directed RNA polymerase specialized sigma24 family protein
MYDTDSLLAGYQNYIKTLQRKYSPSFYSTEDMQDLYRQIEFEFVKLAQEYNPHRGVDFPGYISMKLPKRVYHYVMKSTKSNIREAPTEESVLMFGVDEMDNAIEKDFRRIEAITMAGGITFLSENRKRLLNQVLVERLSLEEIAIRENVDIKTLRIRFHFLLKRVYDKFEEMELNDEEDY